MSKTKELIDNIDFTSALGERYLAYALSTIMSRSLPDVRDGLKPVHRRLLYAMRQLNLNPSSGFKKCARVVGDVIGKYHPHGDVAVYDTLVRLAQGFTLRYPLIEGQGNFGSIDGDNPAAMRYTESRLTEIATFLLKGLDEDTVDFKSTYDDQDQEPTLLPAAFPNLLANGSEGIAVGMATSVPPHNLHELCDGLFLLLKNPDASVADLLKIIKGPDFPTGGVIVEDSKDILKAYETGKGYFRIRAKWHKENLQQGNYQIIINEIPYQVQKSKLIERIADLFKDKKLTMLSNIRDESAEDIRIVLEPKNRACSAEMIMEALFKTTDLEVRYNLNLNVLDENSTPRVMNLKEVLEAFLDHRFVVLIRKSRFRLKEIIDRIEILQGLLIAYLNLDQVISIIRTEDEPLNILMQLFGLSERQCESILNMRLKNLRKLEEIVIKTEHNKLLEEKKQLELILSDHNVCKEVIRNELKEIQVKYSKNTIIGKRLTEFADYVPIPIEFNPEIFIEREAVTVICSKMGWIRCVKGHNSEIEHKYKDADQERFVLKAYTTDKLLVFTEKGKFYTIIVDKISKGKGHGDPIRILIDLDEDDEIVTMFIFKGKRKIFVASKSGKGFLVDEEDLLASTKNGKQILNLVNQDKAFLCKEKVGDSVAVIGDNRKLLIFKSEELPVMKRGKGVTLQKYKESKLSDVKFFEFSQGLSFSSGGKTILQKELITWLNKRSGFGKLPPIGFPKTNKFED